MTRVIAIVLAVLSVLALILSVSIDPRAIISPQTAKQIPIIPTPTPADRRPMLSSLLGAVGLASDATATPVAQPVTNTNLAIPTTIAFTGQSIALRPVKAMPVINSATVNVKLIPDSELVNGPGVVEFDVRVFLAPRAGYINRYTERVGEQLLTGPQIIERVARQFSVNPRLLIALIEFEGSWIDDATPTKDELSLPLRVTEANRLGKLYWQLTYSASKLNEGYYGKRLGTRTFVESQNKKDYANIPNDLNAGTAGVQNYLAYAHPKSAWNQVMGNDAQSFIETYRKLFGDPQQYDKGTPIPDGIKQPIFALPWANGQSWHYTGGPHESWTDGSPWGALDFTPPSITGCQPAPEWVLSVSPGYVVNSNNGEVLVSLDPSQDARVGWSLLYMHMSSTGRVKEGVKIQVGDRIGHPSCEGGQAIAAHLHFARKYNGEWVPAVGKIPFVLDGWVVFEDDAEFDGKIVKGDITRYAEQMRNLAINGVP
ncbi:MAG: peptidoglycan DD-metalloendopeptidase family protein [Chloroflexi bacterium]|nr:peptidoglycan DD-metalloendopeptidase family protein [Chloroflexota bacterium]